MTPQETSDCNQDAMAGFAGPYGSATIGVFATMPDGERRHERYLSRDAAAKGIRDCRAKGGSDINIFDPWLPKSPNVKVSEGGARDSRIETAAQSRPSLN